IPEAASLHFSTSPRARLRRPASPAAQSGCKVPAERSVVCHVERGGNSMPIGPKGMVFDLICRGCGACAQRTWDPADAVSATSCPDCDAAMSVIGIDFPAGREDVGLARVLEVIQGAGIMPVAVERHARGRLQAEAA